MAEVSVQRRVAAPPEVVFAVASDLRRASDYVRGIVRLDVLTDGPVGVGTRFRVAREVFGKEVGQELVFTRFDPPRGYRVTCRAQGFDCAFELRLAPSGDGTDAELVLEAKAVGLLGKAMEALAKPMLASAAREMMQDLDDLAGAAETRAGADEAP